SLDPSNDNGLVHHRVVLHATPYNGIALANVTADTMAGPEADATLGERRDRDGIEGLMGVEGIQQAREEDGLPAMATVHKIDLKGTMTDLTGDGAGVAPDSIPAIGQCQPTCDAALPTGDDAMPVLVEIDLRDHDGVCHGSCAFCAGCRLASPSLPFIGVSGPRLERGQGRPRRRDRSAAACTLPSGRRSVHASGEGRCSDSRTSAALLENIDQSQRTIAENDAAVRRTFLRMCADGALTPVASPVALRAAETPLDIFSGSRP